MISVEELIKKNEIFLFKNDDKLIENLVNQTETNSLYNLSPNQAFSVDNCPLLDCVNYGDWKDFSDILIKSFGGLVLIITKEITSEQFSLITANINHIHVLVIYNSGTYVFEGSVNILIKSKQSKIVTSSTNTLEFPFETLYNVNEYKFIRSFLRSKEGMELALETAKNSVLTRLALLNLGDNTTSQELSTICIDGNYNLADMTIGKDTKYLKVLSKKEGQVDLCFLCELRVLKSNTRLELPEDILEYFPKLRYVSIPGISLNHKNNTKVTFFDPEEIYSELTTIYDSMIYTAKTRKNKISSELFV